MNWDQIKGNWKQFTGRVKEKWGKLTDDDLTTAAGHRDQVPAILQKRWATPRKSGEELTANALRE